MHILHVISSSGLYGAERTICNLVSSTSKYFFSLFLFKNSIDSTLPFELILKKNNVNVISFAKGDYNNYSCFLKIFLTVKTIRPNLIHAHGYKALFYSLIIHWLFKIPFIYMQHGFVSTNAKLKIYNKLDMLICKYSNVSKVICVSEAIYKHYSNAGVALTKLIFLRNGVPVTKIMSDRSVKLKHNPFIFVCVGRLSKEKGQDILIQSFIKLLKSYNDSQLWLVGDGSMHEDLLEIVSENNVNKNIIFKGFLHNIDEPLSAADCFILPSLTEGTPMALLEAMTHALPVICTSVGEIPQIIDNRISGLLVSPGIKDELLNAMLEMISMSAYERNQMGVNGFNKILSEYSMDKYLPVLEGIYETVGAKS